MTYHVLTKTIDCSKTQMVAAVNGKRLEALCISVNNATQVELPAHFKSPLAKNFKYYADDQVEKSAVTQLYTNYSTQKSIIYNLVASPKETEEGTAVNKNCDIYVTYEYDEDNTIAKLDGSKEYNIAVKTGFLALNRGRNNRPAVVPRDKVTAEQLTSTSFVRISNPGGGITTYWSSGDNKNTQSEVEKQFHFLFTLEGEDPYNIIIRTAYHGKETYIEKDGNTFVYKWYKDGSIFAVKNANCYVASDDHRKYNITYNPSTYPTNPTKLAEGAGNGWDSKPGFYHGQGAPIWGSFAILNNTNSQTPGYLFMATRTIGSDGKMGASSGSYNYLKFDNNNLTINTLTPENATASYSTDQKLYEVKTVYFKVKTPFYAVEKTNDHIVSASVVMSGFKIDNSLISKDDIPDDLKRKYCNFTTFRNSANEEITKYSQMKADGIIYVDYEVAASIPFKGIVPKSTYTVSELTGASWYELTDEGSTEKNGKKLIYDGSSYFKNNGAYQSYEKTSEFAFIGDPYELRVILRSATSGATPAYVGASGTPPDSPTNLTVITTNPTAGYKWEIPYDTYDNFLLKLYKGSGNWNWTATNRSVDVTYGSNKTLDGAGGNENKLSSNAQTVIFNVSGLTVEDGYYIKVTKGDTDGDAQILSTTPTLDTGIGSVTSTGTGVVTATIDANTSNADKTFTLTIT